MTPVTFTVDELHLAMVQKFNISSLNGVPTVDPKRPYGNSDELYDLVELYADLHNLEVVKIEDRGGVLLLHGDKVVARGTGEGAATEDVLTMLTQYHNQMETVLQILVDNLSLSVGTYGKESDYSGKWERGSLDVD